MGSATPVVNKLIILNTVLFFLHVYPTFSLPDLSIAPLNLIRYMFGHAGFMHLFGNMLVLNLIGRQVERELGSIKFLVVYLGCGVVAALGFAVVYPSAVLIGASGAISGLLAIYPFCFTTFIDFVISGLIVGVYFFQNFISAWAATMVATEVAFLAHVAGAVTGLIMFCFYKRSSRQLG